MNCPTCNRSSSECRFIGEFCEFCATDIAKRHAPEIVVVEQCRLCERIRIKGVYRSMDNDSIKYVIESEMKMPGWKVEVESIADREAIAEFYYSLYRDIAFEKSVHMKIVHRTCTDCFRRSSGYYEAIVQLRGEPAKVEKASERIDKFLQSRGAFIAKIEKTEGGCDIYLSSKDAISEFFMQRKLTPKKSFHLYGMKKNKRLYRNTYYLRL